MSQERRSAAKLLTKNKARRIAGQLCGAADFNGRDLFGF